MTAKLALGVTFAVAMLAFTGCVAQPSGFTGDPLSAEVELHEVDDGHVELAAELEGTRYYTVASHHGCVVVYDGPEDWHAGCGGRAPDYGVQVGGEGRTVGWFGESGPPDDGNEWEELGGGLWLKGQP